MSDTPRTSKLTFALGVLNGAVGDYLARTGNELAFDFSIMANGRAIELEQDALRALHPHPTSRVVVLVHGLMNTEECFFSGDCEDYGTRLARDFGLSPYYVRYNSGLPIPDNGERFARLLTALVAAHPVPVTEIVLVGYSMGGLVIRSACHVARAQALAWLPLVTRAIYVGTPHRGAPTERAGRVLTKLLAKVPDPYAKLVAQLGDLRSAGIKDLGDADLTHDDREKTAAARTFGLRDPEHPVPLLPEIEHFLICASASADPTIAMWFGDTIVPLPSASFGRIQGANDLALDHDHVIYLPGLSHIALPCHDRVWEAARELLSRPRPTTESA